MVTVLAVVLIATLVSIALIGLMNTDLTHASLQHAVARSFYLAQAVLQDAKVKITAAADPAVFTTPAAGVTVTYGSGHFMYWVDAGSADHGCAPGLKTLEAHGSVGFLGRTIGSRVRACGVPGTPVLAALFGVGRVEFQGSASRVYLAPYRVGSPGGGGSIGSFTEVNFADGDVRLNALSEDQTETVALRDGTTVDYALYGFAQRPDDNPNAAALRTALPPAWTVRVRPTGRSVASRLGCSSVLRAPGYGANHVIHPWSCEEVTATSPEPRRFLVVSCSQLNVWLRHCQRRRRRTELEPIAYVRERRITTQTWQAPMLRPKAPARRE